MRRPGTSRSARPWSTAAPPVHATRGDSVARRCVLVEPRRGREAPLGPARRSQHPRIPSLAPGRLRMTDPHQLGCTDMGFCELVRLRVDPADCDQSNLHRQLGVTLRGRARRASWRRLDRRTRRGQHENRDERDCRVTTRHRMTPISGSNQSEQLSPTGMGLWRLGRETNGRAHATGVLGPGGSSELRARACLGDTRDRGQGSECGQGEGCSGFRGSSPSRSADGVLS